MKSPPTELPSRTGLNFLIQEDWLWSCYITDGVGFKLRFQIVRHASFRVLLSCGSSWSARLQGRQEGFDKIGFSEHQINLLCHIRQPQLSVLDYTNIFYTIVILLYRPGPDDYLRHRPSSLYENCTEGSKRELASLECCIESECPRRKNIDPLHHCTSAIRNQTC